MGSFVSLRRLQQCVEARGRTLDIFRLTAWGIANI